MFDESLIITLVFYDLSVIKETRLFENFKDPRKIIS